MTEEKRRKRVKLTQGFVDGLRPADTEFALADDVVRGLQVRVSPSGTKVYSIRATMKDGRRLKIAIGNVSSITLDAARKLAKKEMARVLDGEDPIETKRNLRVEAITLREFMDHPEKYIPGTKSNNFDHGKPLPEKECKRIAREKAASKRLKKCFADFLDRRLNDRTLLNAIKNWRAKRVEAGTKESTVNRDVTALRGLLSRALEAKLIAEHPLKGLKKLEETSSEKKVRYLTEDEEKRLRNALDAREARLRTERESHRKWHIDRDSEPPESLNGVAFADHLKPMVILSCNTGVRRGELFDIEWRDVDFNALSLTVRAEISKTKKARTIPLNSEALSVLTSWHAQTDKHGRVFKNKDCKRFDNVNSSWEGVLAEAKITRFRWHDMRHHFASKLVMAGVDLPTVRELMGHSKYEMTLRYAHLSPHHTARAVEVASYRPSMDLLSVRTLSPTG